MKKISYGATLLIGLEGILLLTVIWILVRNVATRSEIEKAVIGSVFCTSALALLICSIALRKALPKVAMVAWLTLFVILVMTVIFPRL